MNAIIRRISIFALFVTLLTPPIILSQEKVGGRAVISGIWNGKATNYTAGGVAIKVKKGYGSTDLAFTFAKFHSTIKQDFDHLGWG